MSLAWGGYTNGRIPASALVDVGGGHLLQPDAARNFLGLVAAVRARTGATISFGAGQEAYRDYDRQVYWKNYYTKKGTPKMAATPGTSNHGWGRAVDISGYGPVGGTVWKVLAELAPQFGYSHATGAATGESWHWEYVGAIGSAPSFSQDVANRQAYLNATFGAGLAVDGLNGPKTKAAIAAYQRVLGITADGIWGPVTQAKHQAYYDAHHAPAPPVAPSGALSYADIQRGLNKFGYGLAVDGVWGPKSHNALGDFQRKHGLAADFIVGPKTRAALGI